MTEFLLAAQVSFSCLNRDVTQEKLDLFEFSTSQVTKTCARTSQIMGSQIWDARTVSRGSEQY